MLAMTAVRTLAFYSVVRISADLYAQIETALSRTLQFQSGLGHEIPEHETDKRCQVSSLLLCWWAIAG